MRLPPHQAQHRWSTAASVDALWSELAGLDGEGLQVVEAVAPHWVRLGSTRSSGALASVDVRIGLEPTAAGTEVRLDLRGEARTVGAWPWSRSRAHALADALRVRIASLAAELGSEAIREPVALAPERRQLLAQRLDSVDDAVAERLAALMETAPAWRLARLRPKLLARLWDLPEPRVLDAFVAAVHAGVLQLSWESACPHDREPGVVGARLDGALRDAHCAGCRLRCDLGFAEMCHVVFAPVPELRVTEADAARRRRPPEPPAIVAETVLGSGAEWRVDLDLAPGVYRVECDRLERVGRVEVAPGEADAPAVFELAEYGVVPATLHLAPGARTLVVRSRLSEPTSVGVQSRTPSPATLTIPQFLSCPHGRSLLPESAVQPGRAVIARRGVALAVRCLRGLDPDRLAEAVAAHAPQALHRDPQDLVAVWWSVEAALDALADVVRLRAVCGGLAVGDVVMAEHGESGGSAVAHARAAAQHAGAGRVLLTRAARRSPECAEVLGERPLEACGAYVAWPMVRDPETTAPPDDGAQVGAFVLHALLDEGGFGAVYDAHHVGTGEAAAVKVLRGRRAEDPLYVERFHEECRLTASVSDTHPGLARVFDWGFTDEGRLYLAMERLYGPMFAEEIQDRGGVSSDRAAAIAASVLDVLATLHAHDIVHCDVKPENVLIAHDRHTTASPYLAAGERVFLLDLGVCSEIRRRFPGSAKHGTRRFMSPEQRAGQPLDARADVFSVGVLVLDAVLGHAPASRSEAVDALPSWLAPVVARALADDREARWPDALAMREALLDAIDGHRAEAQAG